MSHALLPLAASLSIVATASAQSPATPTLAILTVELYSYGYTPETISMAAGKPMVLRLVNRADKAHDFSAERFFQSSQILSGSAPAGEVDLAAGATASITLVPTRGRYEVHCSRFFHDQLGMHGWIFVA